MAKVRCPCGRQYNVPDQHLGKRVKCAACGETFTATAAAAPPKAKPRRQKGAARPEGKARRRSRGKHHLGDLAVQRGYVTREQLDACLTYQKELKGVSGHDERRLGDILVRMGLLTQAQLDSLLSEQTDGVADAIAEAAAGVPKARPREHAVSEERLGAIRESVRAAAEKQKADGAKAGAPARHRTGAIEGERRWFRPLYIAIAVTAAVLALLVLWLWPAPEPTRVVDAYLASCSEDSVQPDRSLALRDLEMVVRDYSHLEAQAQRRYDYTEHIEAAKANEENPSWQDVLAQDDLPAEKRRALEMLLPALPKEASPAEMTPLTILLRPVVGRLWWRRRGAGAFFEGTFRFHVLRVESPTWTSDWRIADYERVEAAQGR